MAVEEKMGQEQNVLAPFVPKVLQRRYGKSKEASSSQASNVEKPEGVGDKRPVEESTKVKERRVRLRVNEVAEEMTPEDTMVAKDVGGLGSSPTHRGDKAPAPDVPTFTVMYRSGCDVNTPWTPVFQALDMYQIWCKDLVLGDPDVAFGIIRVALLPRDHKLILKSTVKILGEMAEYSV